MNSRRDKLKDRAERLVEHVHHCVEERPGERSALRRSLGGDPADLDAVRPAARRVVVGHLRDDDTRAVERSFYAVASLIAAQPRDAADTSEEDDPDDASPSDSGRRASGQASADLGGALAQSVLSERRGRPSGDVDPGTDDEERGEPSQEPQVPQEKRLHLLCRQDIDGLHRHLPRVVRYLRSRDVTVDWSQLTCDLAYWGGDGGRNHVAKRWLDSYYRALANARKDRNDQRPHSPETPEAEGD